MAELTQLDDWDTKLVERGEAEYFRRFLAGAPDSAQRRLGIRTQGIADGIATAMRFDPSGHWTKAMGFGFDAPVDDSLITDVVHFFLAQGKDSGIVAIAPRVVPDNWEEICTRHGLVRTSDIAKLACPVADFTSDTTDLQIRQLSVDDVNAWARIIREAFEMLEPDLTPLLAAVLQDPLARVFGAWDGSLLVGAGAVHLLGEVAALNTGGTLPTHRGRGVQSALIAARAEAAASEGCRLLSAETGASPDGNPSYRNLVRSGFTHHYNRTNWRWVKGSAQ